MKDIIIGNKKINYGRKPFIIAEAGVNHNGSIELAKQLIDAAATAGADAVKFQTFIAEEESTSKTPKAAYQKGGTNDSESYIQMIKKLEFNEQDLRVLMDYCQKKNIIFLSTPSEEVSADLLQKLDVPAFKIGSNDLVTTPMLEKIAKFGKPMIISTGMATLNEVEEALSAVNAAGNNKVIILQCTTSYPAPIQNLNLKVMDTFKNKFNCLVGYSDHSEGIEAAVLAALLGAVLIEKHITVDKNLPGPDQKFSLEPQELKVMVSEIRRVESLSNEEKKIAIGKIKDAKIMLGDSEKKPTKVELEMRKLSRKGIVARKDIKKGEVLEESFFAYKRPALGLPPKVYKQLIGKRAVIDIAKDEFITEDFLL